MNKKILLFSATLGIAYLGITGYKTGPGGASLNLTGSSGSGASCGGSGCHSASSGKTIALTGGPIFLKVKSTSVPVTNGKYIGGTTYVVTFSGTNSTPLPKFGFQIACVKSDKTSAGTLTATATNTVKRTLGGVQIIEHTAALPQGSLPGTYNVSFDWTAPAAGTGAVTFAGIFNAVNGTGDQSGDEPSNGLTQVFNEQPASIGEIKNEIASKIYPNPCTNVLNIEAAGSAKFMATVYDLAGRVVIAPAHQSNIDVSALTSGVYLLRLNTEDGQQTATFVKQ